MLVLHQLQSLIVHRTSAAVAARGPTLGMRRRKSQPLVERQQQQKFVSPMLRTSSLHSQAQGHGAVHTLGMRRRNLPPLVERQKKYVSPMLNQKD